MKKNIILRLLAVFAALSGLLSGCGGTGETVTEPSQTRQVLPTQEPLNVWCFQAGKADAFLLWNSAGAVLIDTGESGFGKTILEKLEELGIGRLDYLIITHFDKDHVGGAKKILNSIPVGTVLQSNCPKTGASAYENYLQALQENGVTPVTLRQSLSFTLGDTAWTVDPPEQERYAQDESNNSSLIVSVTHGDNCLLFLADAEDLRLAEFLSANQISAGFVKLPHHGKYQSTLPALLRQTSPQYALITSSETEPEDAETMELLAQAGVEAFLTRQAPVLLRSDGAAISAAYVQ